MASSTQDPEPGPNILAWAKRHPVAIVCVFLAYQFGTWYAEVNPVEYRYKTETVTEVERVYTPTSLPPACKELTPIVADINKAASRIDASTTDSLDAISTARQMIADQNINEINAVDERLQAISSSALGGSETLSDKMVLFERYRDKCDEQIRLKNNDLD